MEFSCHVDDILFCGHAAWWKEVVVPQFQKRITISYDELVDEWSSISFLKRRILKTEKGLALIPGTNAEKVVRSYEEHFGKIRAQMVPCDQSMQTEDLTEFFVAQGLICLQVSCWCLLVLGKGQARLAAPGQGAQWVYEQTDPSSLCRN